MSKTKETDVNWGKRIREDRLSRAHIAAILTEAVCGNEESGGQHVRKEFDLMFKHVNKTIDKGGE